MLKWKGWVENIINIGWNSAQKNVFVYFKKKKKFGRLMDNLHEENQRWIFTIWRINPCEAGP